MVRLCSAESSVATCDSYNFDKLIYSRNNKKKKKPKKRSHRNKTININTDTSSPKPKPKPNQHQIHNHHLRSFPFSDVSSATNNFSPSSLLGKGSHGAVYSALLNDGTRTGTLRVAVKRSNHTQLYLSSSIRPSTTTAAAANNEMDILSEIRSPRLVNLLGYAVDPTTSRILLVVEHMPNGSLYDLLHNNNNSHHSNSPPSWPHRLRLAIHVAKAARHLHRSDPPVVHRDIKSSNVLIDGSGRARLSDFGLAVRGSIEDLRAAATPPAGTLGYLDPCYVAPEDISTKTDVFSFGILLLEIVSGRRAMDFDHSPASVVDWAVPLVKSGRYEEICDRRIGRLGDRAALREVAVLAARCVRSTAEKRPEMGEVVERLESAYRRIRSPTVWNDLTWRVVERRRRMSKKSKGLLELEESSVCSQGEGEDYGKSTTATTRRSRSSSAYSSSRSRRTTTTTKTKVIPTDTETGVGAVDWMMSRSRSTGSLGDILRLVGSISSGNGNGNGTHQQVNFSVKEGKVGVGRPQQRITLKVATVKLSKSKSMGVLGGLDGGGENNNL